MAYKTEIQIGVKGTAALDKLRKDISDLSEKVNLIDRNFRSGIQSVARYDNALREAANTLRLVRAGTDDERVAIQNYVTALNNAHAAQDRQNSLIEEEIARRRQATVELNNYKAAQIAASRQVTPGTQYGKPIGPQPKGARTGTAGFLKQAGAFGLGTGFPLLFGGGAGQVIGGGIGTALAKSFGLADEAAMGLQIGLSAIVGKAEELVRRFTEVGNAINALNMDALADSFITVNEKTRTLVSNLIEAGHAQDAVTVAASEAFQQTGVAPEAVADITNNVNFLSNAWDEVVGSVSGLLSILATPFVTTLGVILKLVAKAVQGVNLIASGIGWVLKRLVELVRTYEPLRIIIDFIAKITKGIVEEEEKGLAQLKQTTKELEREYEQNKALFEIEKDRTAGRTAAEKTINAKVERTLQLKKLEFETNEKIRQNRIKFAQVTGEQADIERKYQELVIKKNAEIEKSRIDQTFQMAMQNAQLEAQKEKEKELAELAKKRTEMFAEMTEGLQNQNTILGHQAEILTYNSQMQANDFSLAQARLKAESDLLGLEVERLKRLREQTDSVEHKLRATTYIYDRLRRQAKLEYESQLLSLRNSVAQAKSDREQVRIKEQQLRIQIEILIAQAQGIQNEEARDAAVARAYRIQKSSLSVVTAMNKAADKALQTSYEIAKYELESAKYAYVTKVEALNYAEANEKNAIVTDAARKNTEAMASASGEYARNMERAAIASSQQATPFQRGVIGATQTNTVSTSIPIDPDIRKSVQGRVGGWKNPQAMVNEMTRRQNERNISNARKEKLQKRLEEALSNYIQRKGPRYAEGGYVNGPHIGMVGEAGPEYIVPERKAAAFATNYLMGARGAGAIPRYAEGGYVGSVNIQTGPVMQQDGTKYVTLADMEKAFETYNASVSRSMRTYGGRSYQGIG